MSHARCNDCEFVAGLYYDADFQVWVRVDDDGTLAVGMTDISQTIAGKILNVRVRKAGTARPAGRPVATIESAKWAGPVPNLFDCVIAAANVAVLDQPSLLNTDPYAAWIVKVHPARTVAEALAPLISGETAYRGFCERCRHDRIRCQRLAPA